MIYRVYEKIKDLYFIQNMKTLEVEMIDEKTYQEGMDLGLLELYDIKSEITRKLISNGLKNGDVVFQTNYYIIRYFYRDFPRGVVLSYDWDKCSHIIKNTGITEILCYYPLDLPVMLMGTWPTLHPLRYDMFKRILPQPVGVTKSLDLKFYNNASIFNIDFKYLDTSQVTSLHQFMSQVSTIEEIKLNFDVSNVTDARAAFKFCEQLREVDMSTFKTLKGVDITDIFIFCNNLERIKVYNNEVKRQIEQEIKEYIYQKVIIDVEVDD